MVQLMLNDLEESGYLRRTRVGRRNEYVVVGGPLRHPLEQEHQVGELLEVLGRGVTRSHEGNVLQVTDYL